MDARDFIFPGVILVLVIIIGIGLLLTHSEQPVLVPTNLASSTETSTVTSATTTSAAPANGQAYGSVTLALGQAAVFADGLSIRPMRILEDSRCPADVQCIQAGTVKLSINTVVSGKTSVESISIGQSVQLDGDTITLDTVTPQKTKAGYPAANEYRFTFTVTHS